MKRILLCLLLFFTGCSQSTTKHGSSSIGRDPTWFPLRLGRNAINVTGFSNALVQEISKVEDRNLEVVDISWIQLFEGLEKGEYAAVLTSLEPNVITEENYSFSDPFLHLGPVLIVPKGIDAKSLSDLEGRIVGAYTYDDSVLILQRYPSIIIETYPNVTEALQGIMNGSMSGALVPNLEARALIPSLYANELKIVTQPLSNKGLRLATLKNKNMDLIKSFNSGLEKLRNDGSYMELRSKFQIK